MRALEVMNLTLPVTPEDIKRRYRELAKQWHPDLHPGDPSAEGRMKVLTGAAEILTGIHPSAMPRYAGATFMKELHRTTIDAQGVKFTLSMGMQGGVAQAADWIYAANFCGRSHGVYLAGYSARSCRSTIRADRFGHTMLEQSRDGSSIPETIFIF